MTYRDEKESLRAENERLRASAGQGRRRRPWVAVVLGVVTVVALFLLQPWLNGADSRFWGAAAILGVLALSTLFAVLRLL